MNKRNLTEGNVTKTLLAFAAPMILGNLLQQFYNIVDTWVVGRFVGSQALAAVGSSYTLMTFLNSILIGLCMGSGALFSFYAGKGNRRKMLDCMQTAFVLIGVISVILTILMELFTGPMLLFLRVPRELQSMMGGYLRIVFCGIIFIFLYNYYAYQLRSQGNSSVPLAFLGAASILNVILDLFFVIVLKWGMEGAAAATVFSQMISGVGLGAYTWCREKELRFSWNVFRKQEKPVREILQYSILTCAQQSVMNFGILMVQGLVNSFGTAVMAAFAAAVKIDTFAYMPAQEFGNAYSLFISQNFGGGKRERLREGTKKACLISAVFCVFISMVVYGFARELMCIFVKSQETEIIGIGVGYLRIEGAFYVGIGILFLLYGYFRGVNRPQISLLLTVISLGTRVVLAYTLAAIPAIGVLGIWWAIPVGWFLADATGAWLLAGRCCNK